MFLYVLMVVFGNACRAIESCMYNLIASCNKIFSMFITPSVEWPLEVLVGHLLYRLGGGGIRLCRFGPVDKVGGKGARSGETIATSFAHRFSRGITFGLDASS